MSEARIDYSEPAADGWFTDDDSRTAIVQCEGATFHRIVDGVDYFTLIEDVDGRVYLTDDLWFYL